MNMAVTKEEIISDLFVEVELELEMIIDKCANSAKTFELSEWANERCLTLQMFDNVVMVAEGHDESAKYALIRSLRNCLCRVRFANKMAQFGLFIVFDGPGKMIPVPGFILQYFKGNAYEKL